MSYSPYIDNQLLMVLFLAITPLWVAFFYLNKGNLLLLGHNRSSALIDSAAPETSATPRYFFKLSTSVMLFTAAFSFNLKAYSGFTFFEQFNISPLTVGIFTFSVGCYAALQLFLYFITSSSLIVSLEYVFCLSNFFLISPVLYLSANLYSFFFTLELVNVLIFLKFSSLQLTTNLHKLNNSGKNTIRPVAAKTVTTLFIQYWVSFFSSVFLITFIILTSFFFGTTSYLDLGVLSSVTNFSTSSVSGYFSSLWGFLLLVGFFLKAGMAPFHNFKTEIYKGLPLLTVFAYTFIFFITFFLYFIYLLLLCLPYILINNYIILVVILTFSILYLLSNLFSTKYVKSFLALSSVINSLMLLIVAVSIAV